MNIFVCDRMTPAPFIIDEDRVRADYVQDQLNAIAIWNESNDGLYNMPRAGINLTVEESQEYNRIYADIETYEDEHIVKFVVGDESLDEFDNFVSTLKQMGIEDCIAIEQAAYDRYLES
jgi:putative aldouronate transport system substrate-binding protein